MADTGGVHLLAAQLDTIQRKYKYQLHETQRFARHAQDLQQHLQFKTALQDATATTVVVLLQHLRRPSLFPAIRALLEQYVGAAASKVLRIDAQQHCFATSDATVPYAGLASRCLDDQAPLCIAVSELPNHRDYSEDVDVRFAPDDIAALALMVLPIQGVNGSSVGVLEVLLDYERYGSHAWLPEYIDTLCILLGPCLEAFASVTETHAAHAAALHRLLEGLYQLQQAASADETAAAVAEWLKAADMSAKKKLRWLQIELLRLERRDDTLVPLTESPVESLVIDTAVVVEALTAVKLRPVLQVVQQSKYLLLPLQAHGETYGVYVHGAVVTEDLERLERLRPALTLSLHIHHIEALTRQIDERLLHLLQRPPPNSLAHALRALFADLAHRTGTCFLIRLPNDPAIASSEPHTRHAMEQLAAAIAANAVVVDLADDILCMTGPFKAGDGLTGAFGVAIEASAPRVPWRRLLETTLTSIALVHRCDALQNERQAAVTHHAALAAEHEIQLLRTKLLERLMELGDAPMPAIMNAVETFYRTSFEATRATLFLASSTGLFTWVALATGHERIEVTAGLPVVCAMSHTVVSGGHEHPAFDGSFDAATKSATGPVVCFPLLSVGGCMQVGASSATPAMDACAALLDAWLPRAVLRLQVEAAATSEREQLRARWIAHEELLAATKEWWPVVLSATTSEELMQCLRAQALHLSPTRSGRVTIDLFLFNDANELWTLGPDDKAIVVALEDEAHFANAIQSKTPITAIQGEHQRLSPVLRLLHREPPQSLAVFPLLQAGTVVGLVAVGGPQPVSFEPPTLHVFMALSLLVTSLVLHHREVVAWTQRVEAAQTLAVWANDQLQQLTTHQIETEVHLLEQRLVARLASCNVDNISAVALSKIVEHSFEDECTPWLYSHVFYAALDMTNDCFRTERVTSALSSGRGILGRLYQSGSVVTSAKYPPSAAVVSGMDVADAAFACNVAYRHICATPAFDTRGCLVGALVFVAIDATKATAHREILELQVLPKMGRAVTALWTRWERATDQRNEVERLVGASHNHLEAHRALQSRVKQCETYLDCSTQCLDLVQRAATFSNNEAVTSAVQSILKLEYIQWHPVTDLAARATFKSVVEANRVKTVYAQLLSAQPPGPAVVDGTLCVGIFDASDDSRLLGVLYATPASATREFSECLRWVSSACSVALSVFKTQSSLSTHVAGRDRAISEYAATVQTLQADLVSAQRAMTFLRQGHAFLQDLVRTDAVCELVHAALPRLLQLHPEAGPSSAVLYLADHSKRTLWSSEPQHEVAFGDGPVGACIFTHGPPSPQPTSSLYDMYLPLWQPTSRGATPALLGVLEVRCDEMPRNDYLQLRQRALTLVGDLQLASHLDQALARQATAMQLARYAQDADERQSNRGLERAKKAQVEVASAAVVAANRTLSSMQQWPPKRDFWGHALENIEQGLGNLPFASEVHVYLVIPKEGIVQRRSAVLVPERDGDALALVALLTDEDRLVDGLHLKVAKQAGDTPSTDFESAIFGVFSGWAALRGSDTSSASNLCFLRVKHAEDCAVLLGLVAESLVDVGVWWPWMRLFGAIAAQFVSHAMTIEALADKFRQQKTLFLSDANGVAMDLLHLTQATETATTPTAFAQMVAGHVKCMLHAARVELVWRAPTDDANAALAISKGATHYRSSDKSVGVILRSPAGDVFGVLHIDAFDTSLAKSSGLWDQLACITAMAHKQWAFKHELETAQSELLSKDDATRALHLANAQVNTTLQSHEHERSVLATLATKAIQELQRCFTLSADFSADFNSDSLCKFLLALPSVKAARLFEGYADRIQLVGCAGSAVGAATSFSGHPGLAGHLLHADQTIVLYASDVATSPFDANVDGYIDAEANDTALVGLRFKSPEGPSLMLVIHATTGGAMPKSPIWAVLASLLTAGMGAYTMRCAANANSAELIKKQLEVAAERDVVASQAATLQRQLLDRQTRLDLQQLLLCLQPDILAAMSLPELSTTIGQTLGRVVPKCLSQLFWCQRDQFFWVDHVDGTLKQMPSSAFVDCDVQKSVLSGAAVHAYNSATLAHKLVVAIPSPTTNHVLAVFQVDRYEDAFASLDTDLVVEFAMFLAGSIERLLDLDVARDVAMRKQSTRRLSAMPSRASIAAVPPSARRVSTAASQQLSAPQHRQSVAEISPLRAVFPAPTSVSPPTLDSFLEGFLGTTTLVAFGEAITRALPSHSCWAAHDVSATLFLPESSAKPAVVEWFFGQVQLATNDTTVLVVPSVHDDERCRRDGHRWKTLGAESLMLFDLRADAFVGVVMVSAHDVSVFYDDVESVVRADVAPILTTVFAACLGTEALHTASASQRKLFAELNAQVEDLANQCTATANESQAIHACLACLTELYAVEDSTAVRSTAQRHLEALFPSYIVEISTAKARTQARWCMPLGYDTFVWLSNPENAVAAPWTPVQETVWLQYTTALRCVVDRVHKWQRQVREHADALTTAQRRERDATRGLQTELEASQDTIQQLQVTIDDMLHREAKHRELKQAQKQWHRREKDLEQQLMQHVLEVKALKKELKRRQSTPVSALTEARYRGLGQELKELATLEATQVEKLQNMSRHRSFETQT
ncbi:hypothetical protein ACHHYP_07341 [Achlya hypogyna]|uniref:Uncharacterized protein n=1 Tax=Achlya hypogyna TaxID=1202772 RepID=A0A1V9ZMR7_ACHHY|nr:hypothetical protein ACHHYP_07341 [Achlya hypogyna]